MRNCRCPDAATTDHQAAVDRSCRDSGEPTLMLHAEQKHHACEGGNGKRCQRHLGETRILDPAVEKAAPEELFDNGNDHCGSCQPDDGKKPAAGLRRVKCRHRGLGCFPGGQKPEQQVRIVKSGKSFNHRTRLGQNPDNENEDACRDAPEDVLTADPGIAGPGPQP